MAATAAMTPAGAPFKPEEVCLVPENRAEITTEGGLDVASPTPAGIKAVVGKLNAAKIEVSAFIDADLEAGRGRSSHRRAGGRASHRAPMPTPPSPAPGAGNWPGTPAPPPMPTNAGLRVNAGHGLHYSNVREYIEDVPHLHTLNIGHAIVARSISVGLTQAVNEMMVLLRHREYAHKVD